MSMVSSHLEVWLVRNVKTRELRYVLKKDFEGKIIEDENKPGKRVWQKLKRSSAKASFSQWTTRRQ